MDVPVCDGSLTPLLPVTDYFNETYPRPTTLQSSCMCSSVIYALVSACSDCQGGQFESWSTWSANCPDDSSDEDLPGNNISIPAWAESFDVKSDPTYSRSAASSSAQAIPTSTINSPTAAAIAEMPTSSNTFQTTPTNTSTHTESSFSLLATASFGSDPSSTTTGNRTAAIAGGTIAAVVVVLAIGAALVYWYMRRRRRTRVPPSVAYMTVHGLDSSVYLSGLGSKRQLTGSLNDSLL